jgi:GntR family transcriptional repressor for pyruvate dehydrogenase complex
MESTITQRGLLPGARLGTIDEWRQDTGHARATVSEAVRIMIERGTIEVRLGRSGGLFVASSDPVLGIRDTLVTVIERSATLDDAALVHRTLETAIVEEAARTRTPEDLADIEDLLSSVEMAVGNERILCGRVLDLYDRLAQISLNEVLRVLYFAVSSAIRLAVLSDKPLPDALVGDPSKVVEIHRSVVAAIAGGDAARAAAALQMTRR